MSSPGGCWKKVQGSRKLLKNLRPKTKHFQLKKIKPSLRKNSNWFCLLTVEIKKKSFQVSEKKFFFFFAIAFKGLTGAHGFNCKIFINSELIFEIYDENYPREKILMIRDISLEIWWKLCCALMLTCNLRTKENNF